MTIYQKGYVEGGKSNKVLKSVTYTGNEIKFNNADVGTVVVEYKLDGKNYTKLKEHEDYELVYLNNINKGKAVLIVEGTNSAHTNGTFVGAKKTGFTIAAENIKTVLGSLF